jgi:hypothetical protein
MNTSGKVPPSISTKSLRITSLNTVENASKKILLPLIFGASLFYMGTHTVYAGDYDNSVNQPDQSIPSGDNPGQGTGTDTQMNNPGKNNLENRYPSDSNSNNSTPPNSDTMNQGPDSNQQGNTDPGGHSMMRNAIPGSNTSKTQ